MTASTNLPFHYEETLSLSGAITQTATAYIPLAVFLREGVFLNFHETAYGRRFLDSQLPRLTSALERIADGLSCPKQTFPHTISADPNFLHDLYYGDYEPSVFTEQDEKQQALNRAVSAAEVALREELSQTPTALAAFEAYQAAIGERESTVAEQAFESGYRTAVQMLFAGLPSVAPPTEGNHNG